MDAAEVWLEILKIFPYVAVAGFAAAAAIAAYRRAPSMREAGPSQAMLLDETAPDGPEALQGGAAWLRRQARRLVQRWRAPAARRTGLLAVLLALAAGAVAAVSYLQPAGRNAPATPSMGLTPPGGLAASDGGLKFGALSPAAGPAAAEPEEPSDVAWLFGALVSGGRSADAWALLTPEAQRATSVDNFGALLGSAYLLRGSDDAPWRVPGSDTFIFSVSDRDQPSALKGELRIGLEVTGGQWRIASFQLREPEARPKAG
ncbi:MAG TPA: hypothetical protein VLA16_13395 [Ideonella sp.]|nr:hypothetical protein [Ideonella sp.]